METHKLFTKEPIKSIEDIILHKAIPLALEKLADNLEKNNSLIKKQEIINNIPILFSIGMALLRKKNEEGKKVYELIHGCILAAFLNSIEPNFQHAVCYPEDNSYDFLIMKYPRNRNPDFKPLPNKEIYKDGFVFRIELAELVRLEELEKIIADKSKYNKRIILISIAFDGQLNFQDIFKRASNINKNNFETIWLMGQKNNPENENRLCYFIAELVKHKKIYPFFELLIDWGRIKNEINRVLTK